MYRDLALLVAFFPKKVYFISSSLKKESHRDMTDFWVIMKSRHLIRRDKQKAHMQEQNRNYLPSSISEAAQPVTEEQGRSAFPMTGPVEESISSVHSSERVRLRQGVMHVRIRHFYCTLEELFDPSLHGIPFVVGTGTGRPNEPGRVIDVSPAAQRLGVSPGMPLRRAYRLAPRARFLPGSYERYQPILRQVKECYRAYSRIIETIPLADAYIDLRGCEIPFDSPVSLAERLCAELTNLGLVPQIGIANGKALAELAALVSRRDNRQGVLYIPQGREPSFVQTLPLSMLLQVRAAGAGSPGALPDLEEHDSSGSRPPDVEGRGDQMDAAAIAEAVSHFKDFGITTFSQVSLLGEAGLSRRLGQLGTWIYHLACGEDTTLVVPDAPPLSQNARMRFHHAADPDETCEAIRKLATYLGERLREQRLKGRVIALMLWPNRPVRDTRRLVMAEDGEEVAVTAAEETIGGQMVLGRHTDEANVIAHHILMLFAHYHRPANRYLQVQVRIGDIVSTSPSNYTPPLRPHGRLTRKL